MLPRGESRDMRRELSGSLSKSLCHKLAYSNRRKASDQNSLDASLGESLVKASIRDRSLKRLDSALSHTANIQRRVDQQLDVSVRKLNLQPPSDRDREGLKKVVEARRLDFESLNCSRIKEDTSKLAGDTQTAAVLSRISSKLDSILKKNKEDSQPKQTEETIKNESYIELSAKSSQLVGTRPPIPPKDLTRPVWVGPANRSRSKISNGSNGSRDEETKKEEKNDGDSSMSLSKKSDHRFRLLNQKPIVVARRLDQSMSRVDMNDSNLNTSIDVLPRQQNKALPHLLNTASGMKQTSFSILKMLDTKILDSRRKLHRQKSQQITGKILFSGKENRPDQENLQHLNWKQSVEKVYIERKQLPGHKKKDNRVQNEKTFQLEDETYRKPVQPGTNKYEASTSELGMSTIRRDLMASNAMSIQVSKFEVSEEQNVIANSVAQFFRDNMQRNVSPIRKASEGVDYINVTPTLEEEVPVKVSCGCHTTFSKIRKLLVQAESNILHDSKSNSGAAFGNPISGLSIENAKYMRLIVANKKSAANLIALFLKRIVKNRKLSALAKIFSRYKQKKKQDNKKAIVIGR